MKWTSIFKFLFMIARPVAAMQIEADHRTISSFMDKSLTPALDILQVTTDISADNHLLFRVKTRGEQVDEENNDYVLLQILHEKTYLFLLPLNKTKTEKALVYEGTLDPENHKLSETSGKFTEYNLPAGFTATRTVRGAEFTIPLDWINYAADFNFDAYTIQASTPGNTLQIDKVYDQARKGRKEEKRYSAITLLNKICSPKKR